METSKDPEAPIFLDRGSRATRGKRMTKLLDDEVEEDELFWNQEALKEEENDINYEAEPEVADEFDSDFDEDEPEPDEEVDNDADDRTRKKKRLIFPGKPVPKKKKKKKDLSKLEAGTKDEKPTQKSASPEHLDVPDDNGERTVRKSTRTSVIVRQAERDAIRAALQATIKPIKRKKEGEEKRMTQEEMLLEAAQTGRWFLCDLNLNDIDDTFEEIMNLRNLERVLAREEEVKKRAIVHKAVYSGPQIRYYSKDGSSYLEFSKGLSFQSEISALSVPYPEKAVCAVTGLPASDHIYRFSGGVSSLLRPRVYAHWYRDPKTGLPYATKEAFKIIRERFADESSGVPKDMDMGDLFDSLSAKGFSAKRKRSVTSNKSEVSYFRYLARFRRIPALESDSYADDDE